MQVYDVDPCICRQLQRIHRDKKKAWILRNFDSLSEMNLHDYNKI